MKSTSVRAQHAVEEPGADAEQISASLQKRVRVQLLLASFSLLLANLLALTLIEKPQDSSVFSQMHLTTLLLWLPLCALLWRGLSHHEHARFGPANTLTLYRAAGTVVLASWVPAVSLLSTSGFWWLSVSAVFLLTLDGVDGYLARRTGLASAFGARFDMEIDALLTLIISLLLWQSGEVGIWILSLGLMRYAFVLSGTLLKSLNEPLYPSFRRKLICVVQLASLCLMLTPWLEPPWSSALGLAACLLLSASFARDTCWLLKTSS